MRLRHTTTIAAPAAAVWAALNDPVMVVSCLPGATLTQRSGDAFRCAVQVQLGPIAMTYKGKGVYRERDDVERRIVVEAGGRDTRGNGTAAATVTGTLRATGQDKTELVVDADCTLTGRPAQLGQDVIAEVAETVIGQFAASLADSVATAAASGSGESAAEPVDLPANVPVFRRFGLAALAGLGLALIAGAFLRRQRAS